MSNEACLNCTGWTCLTPLLLEAIVRLRYVKFRYVVPIPAKTIEPAE